ncbi:DUF885 domain-containing protein [Anaerosacchariphilus polymeriproducens]|uniref:DUF885 domain-containing protein n=1 Tax=Anaerosacchariphilus polymeriproducens TaxID=1812858 RepID=A0A371AT99_9FIRM|nr:DUF885 domain-containing protein [Anaerosacchariphilus polymeriproducens]RDU22795.1 DUF885 domain-containing protein [Anaerosacchariphilus polymeriproducens]
MKRNAIVSSFIFIICLMFLVFGCNKKKSSTVSSFNNYLNDIFRSEITSNTINLHYTLKNPSSYGIKKYPITLNNYSKETFQDSAAALENYQAVLESFPYDSLNTNQKITYDILNNYFSTELSSKQLYLYSEPLNMYTGVHSQLPILLAEYRIDNEKDIKEYLSLLCLVDEYLKDVLNFEKQKSKAGLFMSPSSAEKIINQCSDFIKDPSANYLIDTFEDRVNKTNLSSRKRRKYIAQNKKAIEKHIIPGYKALITGLELIKDTGVNKQGLCYFPKGKEFYEYLVKYNTGSSRSMKEITSLIEKQRMQDLHDSIKIINKSPAILSKASLSLEISSPEHIVEYLKEKCKKDFPSPINVNYSIKYVHSSLKDVIGPAFYLQPPIDNPNENFIYINKSSLTNDLELFTTLAHEGYPGHLYQNVMSTETSNNPLLCITDYCGFSEGWATYVEMYSYSLAGIDQDLADLLQMDRSILLSLYSTLDIGIHFEGWSIKDTQRFMADFGIDDIRAVVNTYNTVAANPAYYLRYYVGYLEFLSLRDIAKDALGDDFNLKKFHEFLVEFGPAPFTVIEKYMQKWIDSQKSQS